MNELLVAARDLLSFFAASDYVKECYPQGRARAVKLTQQIDDFLKPRYPRPWHVSASYSDGWHDVVAADGDIVAVMMTEEVAKSIVQAVNSAGQK